MRHFIDAVANSVTYLSHLVKYCDISACCTAFSRFRRSGVWT